MANEKITQIEAARRQLHTAILLWFQDGDIVSTHTLAAAAHGIIHDLNRAKKGPPLLFDSVIFQDKKSKRTGVAILKETENFYKHADNKKRQKKELEIEPIITTGYIFTCLWGLQFLKLTLTPQEFAFRSWVWLHHPEWLNDGIKNVLSNGIKAENLETLRSIQKDKFLEQFLLVMARKKRS